MDCTMLMKTVSWTRTLDNSLRRESMIAYSIQPTMPPSTSRSRTANQWFRAYAATCSSILSKSVRVSKRPSSTTAQILRIFLMSARG